MEALSRGSVISTAYCCFLAQLICTFGTPAHVCFQACAIYQTPEQQLSSEADLGDNLHPAGLTQTPSVGRGMFHSEELVFNITSNCMLKFFTNFVQWSATTKAR